MTALANRLFEIAGSIRNFADVADRCVITEVVNSIPAMRVWADELDELRATLSPAELGGVETEQSIAADCYHWIAECIGTLPGYSVQEHVQTMKETLEACSDFLHDFVPSDEGGCDEAVELARNCRAVLSGRIDQYEPTPRVAEAVVDDAMVERACIVMAASESAEWPGDYHADDCRNAMRAALTAALSPPSPGAAK